MKKQITNQIAGWMAGVAGLLFLSACSYRSTEEDWEKNGRVRLHLTWTKAEQPSAMTYYFYKNGTGRPIVRSGNASGYEGSLPAGNYKVAICNSDCNNVVLHMDDSYETAWGKVRQVSSLKSSSVCIAQPENLYACSCEQVTAGGEGVFVEELFPSSLVKTLELNIKIVGSEEASISLSGLSGRLTGVSSQVHIPTGEPFFETPAFLTFDPEQVAAGVYSTSLNLFGLSGRESGSESVCLYLTLKMSNGKEITSFADITDEVDSAFDKSVSAHVVLDLQVEYDSVSGMKITLKGWKEGTGEVGN